MRIEFSYATAAGSLSVAVGGNVFTASDGLSIGVQNAFNDFYPVCASPAGGDPFDISLILGDFDGTAPSSS